MKRLTDEEIDAIRKRVELASASPWSVGEDSYLCNAGFWTDDIVISPGITAEVYDKDDAEFIANARQDIPLLLEEIDRLKRRIERLENPQCDSQKPIVGEVSSSDRMIREIEGIDNAYLCSVCENVYEDIQNAIDCCHECWSEDNETIEAMNDYYENTSEYPDED
ncbi:hypothetical protein P4V41_08005 [Fictibacillus nanhaiensis]|uniref:hypothetical protein n=1 Tax=Fictibacillus nanhaiensis TaxID=742169 RepID=UPI002E20C111|nr:hypothetical protein [Fictibacillus nanhaiensis]